MLKSRCVSLLIGILLVSLVMVSYAQTPSADTDAVEQQVNEMVSKLTLQEKLELIGGANHSYIRAEPTVDLPALKTADASLGVRTWGPDAAYVSGIALAATWDPGLARETGECIGRDARARGVHILLGPGVNIYRAPMNGRNFEYFGEDPYLAAHTAIPYIEGVQAEGVIATVKHFVANNSEYERHFISSDMDERTLREIYLPAFEGAVREAHVGAIMDSYNLINGIYATENKQLNIDILRHEWGFKGIVMSDWGATHSSVDAANGGLDLEMPSGIFMSPENLLQAIRSGQVSESIIDEKVRDILREAVLFRFLTRNQTDLSIPRDNPEDSRVALEQALESTVLLKNRGNLLPLDVSRIHTIAVFGPDAWPAVTGGGGSSYVTPYSSVSLLAGVSDYLAGRAKVLYLNGLPTAEDVFRDTEFFSSNRAQPVKIETFDNPNFSGIPQVRFDSNISQSAPNNGTPISKKISVRYTAQFVPKSTGDYLFLASSGALDNWKLIVDGKAVLSKTRFGTRSPVNVEMRLSVGKPVTVAIDYQPDVPTSKMRLGIKAVNELVSPDVMKMAAMADAAIVSVGFDASSESEGWDRTFALPWGQDELVQAVKRANPHTIVIITAGGNVDMHRWLDDVPALLHNWYPGQEGGKAAAQILFGEHNPEGHLPVSFEKAWEDNSVHDNYYPLSTAPGQIPHVHYREGVFLGYRYYTTFHKEPLFPFGFGLSYTKFSFTNLSVTPEKASASERITVSFDVRNTGRVDGATVAQVYVGDPSAKVSRPARELKGYEKVRLGPGESKHVSIQLNWRSLAYWSEAKGGWEVDPGLFAVYVGDSSDHTPLRKELIIR